MLFRSKDLSRMIKEGSIDVSALPELSELMQNIEVHKDIFDEDDYE